MTSRIYIRQLPRYTERVKYEIQKKHQRVQISGSVDKYPVPPTTVDTATDVSVESRMVDVLLTLLVPSLPNLSHGPPLSCQQQMYRC